MALIPSLSVAENVMFNETVMNMKGKLFMNYGKIRKDAREVLSRLNVNIDVRRPCSSLSLAEKQMVLIARAIQNTCNFLILTSPPLLCPTPRRQSCSAWCVTCVRLKTSRSSLSPTASTRFCRSATPTRSCATVRSWILPPSL